MTHPVRSLVVPVLFLTRLFSEEDSASGTAVMFFPLHTGRGQLAAGSRVNQRRSVDTQRFAGAAGRIRGANGSAKGQPSRGNQFV